MQAGNYEGMYNGHMYLIEQDRLAEKAVQTAKTAVQEEVTWEHVKGHDGQFVRTKDGILMVNNHGEYAVDTYHYLIGISDHEVQQARVKHELREFIN